MAKQNFNRSNGNRKSYKTKSVKNNDFTKTEIYDTEMSTISDKSGLESTIKEVDQSGMSIDVTYKDNITPYVTSYLINYNSLTSIASNLRVKESELQYDVVPDIDQLNYQANYFARTLVANQPLYTGITKLIQTRTFDDAIELVRDSYKYSYFKCIMESKFMYSGNFSSTSIFKGNSVIFGGHQVLFNTIRRKMFTNFDVVNLNTLNRRVNLYFDEIVDLLIEDDLFSRLYDSNSNEFYDPRLESTLHAIHKAYPHLYMSYMSDYDDTMFINPTSSPLGCCCYSMDQDLILIINNSENSSDEISKYWNLACFITLTGEKVLNNGDTIYSSVELNSIDPNTIKFEVRSITGLDILGNMNLQSNSLSQNHTSDDGDDDLYDLSDNSVTKYKRIKERKSTKKNNNSDGRIKQTVTKVLDQLGNAGKSAIDSGLLEAVVNSILFESFKGREINKKTIDDVYEVIERIASEKQITVESTDKTASVNGIAAKLGLNNNRKTIKLESKEKKSGFLDKFFRGDGKPIKDNTGEKG